ncbi:MAG: PQQ-binding-like beta-propeller repeat protein [Armatimonadetes bacterium]|nr:PQQ-binding-like beta-propeller repeat protein [Armatimonadota bacterium]
MAMRLHRRCCSYIAIVLLAAAMPAMGAKTAFRYEQAQRVIKACVLYVQQPGGSYVNSHPGLIEGLRRTDLCPDDWVFENPLAEAAAVAGRPNYIVKGSPAYWRVDLTDDTAPQLKDFDLIYVCAPVLDISSAVQQKGLVQAVDAGALLWVDNRVDRSGPTPTSVVNFPWAFEFGVTDESGASEAVLATNIRRALDTTHGILNEPFALGATAVRTLGDYPQWRPNNESSLTTVQRYPTYDYIFNFDTGWFRTVVQFGKLSGTGYSVLEPNIVAASCGSGSIVLTAGDVGADVVEWINDRLPGPNAQQRADVELALNMIQWADRWEQARRRPSASATTVARASLPLEIDWQYPGTEDSVLVRNIGPVTGTPVHSRGMVFALAPTSASGTPPRLYCFDAEPRHDLDMDREADDGLLRCDTCGAVHDPRQYQPGDPCTLCGGTLRRDFIDWGLGASYDMIWSATLPGSPRASSPTVTTINVMNAAGTYEVPLQVVLVSTVDVTRAAAGTPCGGQVFCYNATIDPNILNELPVAFRKTGDVLWSYSIVGFASGTADVVALSTPIVDNGWIYVLATEYDPALPDLGGKTTERVYGRVHCLNLTATGPTATWEYPTPVADIDGDGGFSGGPENQRSLPPFHDPAWAADVNLAAGPESRSELPPEPGALPIVTRAVDTVDQRAVEALLTFGTTTTHVGDGAAVHTSGAAGSSEIALVPTPQDLATGSVLLNADYCLVTVNHPQTGGAPVPTTNLAANGTAVPGTWFGTRLVRYNPATVREVLADLSRAPGEDPTKLQLGADVLVDYTSTAGAITDEPHFLPGPMRWRHEFEADNRRANAGAQVGDELVVSTGVPVYYTGNSGRSGKITALDASTGEERWTYDPRAAAELAPVPVNGRPRIEGVTAPAFDGDTAVVGATLVDLTSPINTSALTSSVIGLKSEVDATIYLRNGPAGAAIGTSRDDVEVRLYSSGGETIDRSCYRVDRYGRTITFPAEKAGNVTTNNGRTPLGPIYGRAVQVAWRDINGVWRARFGFGPPPELHVVPDIERFRHVPGYIRLRHYPVDMNTPPVITLEDGTPVAGWSVVNHLNPADTSSPSIDGWIAMPASVAGEDVLVSYTGFFEQDGTYYAIPNPALNLSYEKHQVPGEFGPSVSSPIMTGNVIHMGTEGFTGALDGTFDDPVGPADLRDTMLSLLWDKATGYVRSELSPPVQLNASYGPPTTLAAVTSSPSAYGDHVFVGCQVFTAPGASAGYGLVGALKPRGVLVCDNTRLVQTTGSEPAWTCTGTSGPQRLQSFVGEDLRRPFSRPAKATRLGNGNLLVVDSGNNRVVEIDEAGRLVWPRDTLGFEYYTSSANNNLRLSRPADAYRYLGRRQVDSDGDGTPDVYISVWHTVIADTGNARVIDVETILNDPEHGYRRDGRQRHTVVTLTPSAIRLTGGRRAVRVRYTAAQPIFDAYNGELNGYLCAAANLDQVVVVEAGSRVVNPAANTVPPSGAGTWARWAWLYDADPDTAPHVSNQPLRFRNIKHVEHVRYGDLIYVTVTCSRFDGREVNGGHPLAAAGPGVFEFCINVRGAPATAGLVRALDPGGTPTYDEPYWHFVAGAPGSVEADGYNYAGGAMRPITSIVTDTGTYRKRWFPVCAKRLRSGNHLIVNSLSQIENVTYDNLGAASTGGVLGSHVFEVETSLDFDNDPYNDLYNIPADRSVPRPGHMWSDPISQPTYAEML